MRKLTYLALLALGISSGAVAQTTTHRDPATDAAKIADATIVRTESGIGYRFTESA